MNVYLFFSNDILNYVGAVPNYHQIEGILKMFTKIEKHQRDSNEPQKNKDG